MSSSLQKQRPPTAKVLPNPKVHAYAAIQSNRMNPAQRVFFSMSYSVPNRLNRILSAPLGGFASNLGRRPGIITFDQLYRLVTRSGLSYEKARGLGSVQFEIAQCTIVASYSTRNSEGHCHKAWLTHRCLICYVFMYAFEKIYVGW